MVAFAKKQINKENIRNKVFCVSLGSALRCWVCSSNVNVMCGDPMNTTDHQAAFHIKTCEAGHYGSSTPICRKIVKRGKMSLHTTYRVSRACKNMHTSISKRIEHFLLNAIPNIYINATQYTIGRSVSNNSQKLIIKISS